MGRYIRLAERKQLDGRRPAHTGILQGSNHNHCKKIRRDPWGTVHTCQEKEEDK